MFEVAEPLSLTALFAHHNNVGPAVATRHVQRLAANLFDKHPDELTDPQHNALARIIQDGHVQAEADETLNAPEQPLMPATKTRPKATASKTRQPVKKKLTAAQRRARHKGKPSAPAVSLPADAIAIPTDGEQKQIPLKSINPSPLNPRKYFDQAALRKLADSMIARGQMQECVVRPKPSRTGKRELYEIVAGERRYQAALMGKLETLRCRVVQLTDAQVVELAGVENYEREDLNPIEVAGWFKSMIDKAGYTQKTLAARLKISQPLVSQRLALLDLPDAWRDRVITGVIPATWARELAPWTGYPDVLAFVGKVLDSGSRYNKPTSASDFADLVHSAVEENSVSLKGYQNFANSYENYELKPNDEQQKQLDIITLKPPAGRGWGSPTKRAMNVELANQLIEQQFQRKRDRAAKKAERVRDEVQQAKKTGKVSSAEAKQRLADQAKQKARRLYQYKVGWLQRAAIAKLPDAPDDLLQRLVLHFAVEHPSRESRPNVLDRAVKKLGGKQQTRGTHDYHRPLSGYRTLSTVKKPDLRQLSIDLLTHWLADDPFHCNTNFDAQDVEALALELSVDVKRDWRMDRDFLELHTTADLEALAKEWGKDAAAACGEAKKRTDKVDALAKFKFLKAPKALIAAKPVKR